MQCAGEVIMKGTTIYEASLAAESVAGGQGAANRRYSGVYKLGPAAFESLRHGFQRSVHLFGGRCA